ncbi:MAG: hypothetical protein Q9160_007139 [Pyrenula sp. 1 TL-2023]
MGTGIFNRFAKSSSPVSPVSSIEQPEIKTYDDVPVQHHDPTAIHGMHGIEVDEKTRLHRNLKARHITMIAIGGAIGTGLIIGTGAALSRAGPASILISYTLIGALVYLVMCALGEMAAWLPLSSGFTGYATRYAAKYFITTPNQLTAGALIIQYWVDREKVNPGVFIAVFWIAIVFINYFGIRFFGEFEFWLSSIKVVVICGVILLSLILALGGGPDHDRKGFRYWNSPGAFKPYIATGSEGKFLGFWSTMVTATFAYLGTELVGVTVGEAQNPRKTIPRAIKLTFYRILFFYCLSVLLLGMIVPYNSKELAFANKASTSASASPFVVAIQISGISALPGILNACILIFVFSAANSDLYIASRTVYGLASENNAPRQFKLTNARGVPVYALALGALFSLLAFMNVADDSRTVFLQLVNFVTMAGLLTWISILVTHICFVRARRAQNLPDSAMPYVAPLGANGSYVALFFCILIGLTKNYDVFVRTEKFFDWRTFLTAYLMIPVYLGCFFGYKIFMKSERVTPITADLFSGKEIIDREEEEFLARKAERRRGSARAQKGGWFYRTFVGWLF